MTRGVDDVLAEVKAIAERQLGPEEFERRVNAPMAPEERAELEELIDWLQRRYPTPADRLAYVRRAGARWLRRSG
jgi:hypothetical protein